MVRLLRNKSNGGLFNPDKKRSSSDPRMKNAPKYFRLKKFSAREHLPKKAGVVYEVGGSIVYEWRQISPNEWKIVRSYEDEKDIERLSHDPNAVPIGGVSRELQKRGLGLETVASSYITMLPNQREMAERCKLCGYKGLIPLTNRKRTANIGYSCPCCHYNSVTKKQMR